MCHPEHRVTPLPIWVRQSFAFANDQPLISYVDDLPCCRCSCSRVH